MEHSQSTSFLIGWQNWTSGPVLRQRQVTEKTSSGKGKGKGNVKGQVYNIEPFHLAFYKPNQASYETRLLTHQVFREAPFNLSPPLFGHCPFVGGGWLNPCPDGLGHFFREEFSKFKGAFAWFWGGLNPCPDGLGHLFREKMVKNGKKGKKW